MTVMLPPGHLHAGCQTHGQLQFTLCVSVQLPACLMLQQLSGHVGLALGNFSDSGASFACVLPAACVSESNSSFVLSENHFETSRLSYIIQMPHHYFGRACLLCLAISWTSMQMLL